MKKYTVFPDGNLYKYMDGDEFIFFTDAFGERTKSASTFSNLPKAKECAISILKGKIKKLEDMTPKDAE